MSSTDITLLCFVPSMFNAQATPQYVIKQDLSVFLRKRSSEPTDISTDLGLRLRCKVGRDSKKREHTDTCANDLQLMRQNTISKFDEVTRNIEESIQVQTKIKEYVDTIRSMLLSMEDGEISVGAYDTALVALVKGINGNNCPQFPSCFEWISNNQLSDGSWGDSSIFESHDRFINTLACVVALKTGDIHQEKTQKGIQFVKDNLCKLEDKNADHMPIAFEVAFPSLIKEAKKLAINIPIDSPAMRAIYARRKLKLEKIRIDILHTVPTTLLYTLEGIPGIEWEELIKLQFPDGSFLFSPSSTAFAFMQTKNENCSRYLNKTVQKFDGGDKYWTKEGITCARNSRVHGADDTSMGFRLLRLHGNKVSAGKVVSSTTINH